MLPGMDTIGQFGEWFFGALYEARIPVALASVVALVLIALVASRRGWFAAARRHPRRTTAVAVPALTLALALAWYTASPLFISTRIDEAPPVVAAERSPSPSPFSPPSARPTAAAPSLSSTPSPSPTPSPIELVGSFHGSDEFHFGRGTARLIETAPGTFVVRLEDFAVRNGPDLFVYISPSADGYAVGAIELGKLKADTGNQNYEVPAGVVSDPATARSVVIWCKQFSHLFATAPLTPG
jgi:hypothetical protein